MKHAAISFTLVLLLLAGSVSAFTIPLTPFTLEEFLSWLTSGSLNASFSTIWADTLNVRVTNTTYINDTYSTGNITAQWFNGLWNGASDYYNKTEVLSLIPSGVKYYFSDYTSAVNASYTTMNTTRVPESTTTSVSGIADGQMLVGRINENTNLTALIDGTFHGHTHVAKTGGTKELQLRGEVWVRNDTGEHFLFTTDTSVQVDAAGTPIDLHHNIAEEIPLNATDILIWKLIAVVTGVGSDPSADIFVGGSTESGIELPISIPSFVESDPIWAADKPNYMPYSSWNSTNSSYQVINEDYNTTGWGNLSNLMVTNYVYDILGTFSADFNNRMLGDSDGDDVFDWGNKIFYYKNGFSVLDFSVDGVADFADSNISTTGTINASITMSQNYTMYDSAGNLVWIKYYNGTNVIEEFY